jgi:imidazoleglycerol-phosphate dehydratase
MMSKLFIIHKETDHYIKIQKSIKEVDVLVEISAEYNENLKPDTGIDILNHFIWTLSWGLNMSIGCKVNIGKYRSEHTIAEDLGITLGAGLKKFFYKKIIKEGINICGSSVFGLDEALVRSMVNFEGRRNCFITCAAECSGGKTEMVEDTQSANLIAFFEGFSQGFPATIHIDLLQGQDPHHTWESSFMALGEALKMAYSTNPWKIAKNNPFYAEEGTGDASLI